MEAPAQDLARPPLNEAAAFRAFYDDALPRVYSYFFHRCGGVTAVAEELTQETFFAAVAEIRKGREIIDPLHWVLGIARHKLVDHHRRLERHERAVEVSREAVDPESSAWDAVERRELTLRALAAMPVMQRAALVLRYLDDLPVAQVARALGRSVHATESLLTRGRESFRRVYAEVAGD
jgi:RNA polymerase sigma-70 factor (ECF subfamily)